MHAARPDDLYGWFARSAERLPDEPALVVNGDQLSYRQLHRAAQDLAEAITAAGRPRRVGVVGSRSAAGYAGYLAALSTGATVVPLNPAFPRERNSAILRRSGAALLLSADGDDVFGGTEVAGLACGARLNRLTPEPEDQPAGAGAYILFTSGSTGVPKGIPIGHQQVSAFLDHVIARYGLGPGDRLSQCFDLTFDPSVFDLFACWGSGATLVVPQRADLADPVGFVNRERVTHWFSVPSMISLAKRMRRLPAGSMPGLRQSMFAGEALTLEQARAWQSAAPHSSIDNAYGPTELTITCTAYRLPVEPSRWPVTRNGTVPIGQPYPGLDWAVLGTAGSPDEGELCIRGPQRFDGYLDAENDRGRFCRLDWNSGGRPVATDVAGAPGPRDWFRTGDNVCLTEDGLVHLGRLDSQVQVHGYRVELGEVEAALRAHGEVDEAAVVFGDGVLTGWYSGGPGSTTELADWLARTLPSYMIPDRLRRIEALPVTSNGKVDRRALARQAA